MITSAQLYWLTRLDNICNISAILAVIFTAALIVVTVPYVIMQAGGYSNEDATCSVLSSLIQKFLVVFVLSLSTAVFTPSTKDMAAILVIPQIATSEKVQAVGGKLYDLAVEWMDELKPKHEVHQ